MLQQAAEVIVFVLKSSKFPEATELNCQKPALENTAFSGQSKR
jgi:hypothetical protein